MRVERLRSFSWKVCLEWINLDQIDQIPVGGRPAYDPSIDRTRANQENRIFSAKYFTTADDQLQIDLPNVIRLPDVQKIPVLCFHNTR